MAPVFSASSSILWISALTSWRETNSSPCIALEWSQYCTIMKHGPFWRRIPEWNPPFLMKSIELLQVRDQYSQYLPQKNLGKGPYYHLLKFPSNQRKKRWLITQHTCFSIHFWLDMYTISSFILPSPKKKTHLDLLINKPRSSLQSWTPKAPASINFSGSIGNKLLIDSDSSSLLSNLVGMQGTHVGFRLVPFSIRRSNAILCSCPFLKLSYEFYMCFKSVHKNWAMR